MGYAVTVRAIRRIPIAPHLPMRVREAVIYFSEVTFAARAGGWQT
jgi:hypothetical protein